MDFESAINFLFYSVVIALSFYLLGSRNGPTSKPENHKTPKRRAVKLVRFPPNMPAAEIKLLLKSKGFTLTDISREAGVHRRTASECIRGAGRYEKVRRVIAEKLELDVTDIFPDERRHIPLTPATCRALLEARETFSQLGHSARTIARELGLDQGNVSALLNGSNYFPSIAAEIERHFGVTIPDTRRG